MTSLTRRSLNLLAVALLAGCASQVHTLENTKNMSRGELQALCEDLRMRATQDCRWNLQVEQSSVSEQQTWEINCRARRDSARESFDNVCRSSRLQNPDDSNDRN